VPITRPCRNRYCPEPALDGGYCPRHYRPAFATAPRHMPPGWPAIASAAIARAGGRCQDCGAPATDADHIRPRSQGGTDEPANLRALCAPCHASRTGRLAGSVTR
jgi:5-methylcytosine-specific restriction protein A